MINASRFMLRRVAAQGAQPADPERAKVERADAAAKAFEEEEIAAEESAAEFTRKTMPALDELQRLAVALAP